MTKSFDRILKNAKSKRAINTFLTSEAAVQGTELFKERMSIGLTQAELAQAAGIDVKMISKAEAGFDHVSIEIIKAIKSTLNTLQKDRQVTID
ncbi:helix-turn-helix transcriptional regulator [Metabacillus indicus]|uniref:helix-turn-helix domain-containing protein n=1 Tax=Metabacillus indicus TaxID=246786 RepID=UPI00317B0505